MMNQQIMNLIGSDKTLEILDVVRQYQKHPLFNLTNDKICHIMHEKQLSSRPTTRIYLARMLDSKMLLDTNTKKNGFSNIVINPDFDWAGLEAEIVKDFNQKIRQRFKRIRG